ncbi:hypothetical protein [Flavisphingomonas formosensis]|uniref:hypothetical protein n=1 Tax=Flavisphingomonas formosensis TaxID=861534 RepID=UPI0012F86BE4|nr:hypothetical protein [Sphingomonas formosensis]
MWVSYNEALSREDPEQELDALINQLDELVPHANVSDLLFWGEREKTPDEVFDEAIRRELIWRHEGELALLIHIETLLTAALTNPDLSYPCRQYTESELPQVHQQIAELSPNMVQ